MEFLKLEQVVKKYGDTTVINGVENCGRIVSKSHAGNSACGKAARSVASHSFSCGPSKITGTMPSAAACRANATNRSSGQHLLRSPAPGTMPR